MLRKWELEVIKEVIWEESPGLEKDEIMEAIGDGCRKISAPHSSNEFLINKMLINYKSSDLS